MECPTVPNVGKIDQCMRMTTDNVVTFTCNSKALTEAAGWKNNQCTTTNIPANSAAPNGMKLEMCVCDTAGCNSQWIRRFNSASRPANQVIVILAIASLMKLIFNQKMLRTRNFIAGDNNIFIGLIIDCEVIVIVSLIETD